VDSDEATREATGPPRLGWPRLLRRWVPVGVLLGLVHAVVVHLAGYGTGAVLFWQLLQIFGAVLVWFALMMWFMAYLLHFDTERAVPKERRKPIADWSFDIPRLCAKVATVLASAAIVVTVAFAIRTGEVWSFANRFL
jgi:predicted tellurium resistance membrane protein TerC